jgi:hypothetical protein
LESPLADTSSALVLDGASIWLVLPVMADVWFSVDAALLAALACAACQAEKRGYCCMKARLLHNTSC